MKTMATVIESLCDCCLLADNGCSVWPLQTATCVAVMVDPNNKREAELFVADRWRRMNDISDGRGDAAKEYFDSLCRIILQEAAP